MSALYEKSLQKLELNAVLQLLADQACSEEAKARCMQLAPLTDVDDIRQLQAQTTAACKLVVQKGSPGLGGVKDVSASLARADRGGCLSAGELLKIAGVLRCARQVKNYAETDAVSSVLDHYFLELTANKYLEEKIDHSILSEEEIADAASPVDGEAVHTAAALRECLEEEQVILKILRNGREAEFCVRPNGNQIGAYVRDSLAGIGTVTYYDPDTGAFGALGHGVSDSETKMLLPVEAGVVVQSSVADVKKGRDGAPGELKGSFDVSTILGKVERNAERGIFGTLDVPIPGTPLPVAEAGEAEPGPAEIWANVDGQEVRSYSVEILRIYPHADETGRNMLLEVTDPDLLYATGGIVRWRFFSSRAP